MDISLLLNIWCPHGPTDICPTSRTHVLVANVSVTWHFKLQLHLHKMSNIFTVSLSTRVEICAIISPKCSADFEVVSVCKLCGNGDKYPFLVCHMLSEYMLGFLTNQSTMSRSHCAWLSCASYLWIFGKTCAESGGNIYFCLVTTRNTSPWVSIGWESSTTFQTLPGLSIQILWWVSNHFCPWNCVTRPTFREMIG